MPANPSNPFPPMFSRPSTLDDALGLIGDPDAVVLSGGTDFYPQRLDQRRNEHIIDISGVEELRGVFETNEGWRIGGTTTWARIADAELPAFFNGLRIAARQIGATQIQNAGTIAGNLCTASPAADAVPPLLTLEAVVEVRSTRAVRAIPLHEFITGYRSTALLPGELVTALTIPRIPRFGESPAGGRPSARPHADSEPDVSLSSSFVKLGSRSYLVISIAMVAVMIVMQNEAIVEARVAVGACSPVAQRLPVIEAALIGAALEPVAIEAAVRSIRLDALSPIDDVRASAHYRLNVVPQLIVDALLACRKSASAGAPRS